MTTRKWAAIAALVLLSAAVGIAALGSLTRRISTPGEGTVTVSRTGAVTATTVGLPASFAGFRRVTGYRYEAKDAKGGLICNLSHLELVAPQPPAQVAAALRKEREAAATTQRKVTTLWWGTRQDAVVVTVTGHGQGALVVAERAVRKRQGPRLPGEKKTR